MYVPQFLSEKVVDEKFNDENFAIYGNVYIPLYIIYGHTHQDNHAHTWYRDYSRACLV